MAKKWRPRNGEKIPEPPKWIKVDNYSQPILERIAAFFPKPWWGIVVAALLGGTGRGELLWRSLGFLAIAIWWAIDFWVWLLRKETVWKYVVGWTATNLLLLAVLTTMTKLIDARLRDERDEAFSKISIEYSIPSGDENDPMRSVFSVTNNSPYTIGKNRRMFCDVHLMISANSKFQVDDLTMVRSHKGWLLIGGGNPKLPSEMQDSPLIPGGDAQTDSCFVLFDEVMSQYGGVGCIDSTIRFQYTLEDQPAITQEKRIRVVTYRLENHGFSWYKQPVESSASFCAESMKK